VVLRKKVLDLVFKKAVLRHCFVAYAFLSDLFT